MTTVSVGPAFRSGVPALVLVSFLLLFPFVLGTTISLDALPLPLLALHIYLSVRLAVVATSLNPRLITLMFLLFHYWFFSVVPIHQLSAGRFPEPTSYSSGQLLEVTIYVLVSIVAFDIFASLALRHRQFRLRHIGTALSAQIQRRLLVLGIIATASAAATFGLALVVSGSRDELSRAIQTSGLRLGPGLTAALLLQTVYRVPIFVSVLIVADAARRSGKVAVSRPLLVVSSLALAISISPLNTPRYWTATVLLAFLFVLWPPLTAARRTALVAFALFGLLLVFPVSDAFRHEVSPSAITDEISRSLQDPWASRDWDAFQTTLDASIHRRELNLGPGENLVGAALFWFPRAMWETKPQPTGPLVASAAGYRSLNVSMPLVGEMLVAFGAAGAFVALAAVGWGVGRLELWAKDAAGRMWLLQSVVAAYATFVLRGALMPALAYGAPVLILVVALIRTRSNEAQVLGPGSVRRRLGSGSKDDESIEPDITSAGPDIAS